MAKPRVTAKQREVLEACRKHGRLLRRVDGWATHARGFGAYGFQTVYSLLDRELLSRTTWQSKPGSVTDQMYGAPRGDIVELTPLGLEAL